MVLWEIYFRHGLCQEMTRKQQGSRFSAKTRKGGSWGCLRRSQELPSSHQSYGFAELCAAGLRLRSTATASRLTGFVTSRTAASRNAEPFVSFWLFA